MEKALEKLAEQDRELASKRPSIRRTGGYEKGENINDLNKAANVARVYNNKRKKQKKDLGSRYFDKKN